MVSADFTRMALELPPEERLELARRLVESVVAPVPRAVTLRGLPVISRVLCF